MKKQINRFLLMLFSIIIIACQNVFKCEIISGTYCYSNTCNFILQQKEDSLFGEHCCILHNGNKIDYCDGERNTLLLIKTEQNNFEGFMHSCFWDDTLRIKIIPMKQQVKLIFITAHDFLGDSLILHKK